MSAKLNVYNLGALGVNVDMNSVQLEDGELTQAQNGVHDTLDGTGGGLKNRRGLVKVNSSGAAGAIRGSIAVPISLANQNIGPGGTAPATLTRSLWFGNANQPDDVSRGWWVSTDAMTTVAADIDGTPAAPISRNKRDTLAAPAATTAADNPSAGIQYRNRLIYAADGYTIATNDPPIRMWNGYEDRELCRIPPITVSGTTTKSIAIMQMCLGDNDRIYVSTYDKGTTAADYRGRVFELDPESGALIQVGADFPVSHIPNALCWYQSKLWTGTYTGSDNTAEARIYFIRPGIDTAWTLDNTTTACPGIMQMAHFQGQLYTAQLGGTDGEAPLVRVRSTLGVWSTSLTGGASGTPTFFGLFVFEDKLYTSYFNNSLTATIHQFDGSSWTTVYTAADATHRASYHFYSHNGVLYAVSVTNDIHAFLTTDDGTTWSSKSSLFASTDEFIPIISTVIT